MRTKLQWFDFAVCTAWLVGALSSSSGIYQFLLLAIFFRMVISFLLYRKEKRTWMPLLAFAACLGMHIWLGSGGGIGGICKYAIALWNPDFNARAVGLLMTGILFLWIIIAPFIYYLVMLLRHRLFKTELTKKELFGAIMWNDRRAKYYSVFLAMTVVAIYVGVAMNYFLCKIMCIMLPPLCYWLVCRYNGIKAEKVWLLVIAMFVFWYAQIVGGVFRIGMLAVSFCMVVYICTYLIKMTRQYLLTCFCILYCGILLPSFTIGYNQYVCIEYPRSDFTTLSGYRGIFVIKDSTNGYLYGIRDRYGLLVKPEYETIRIGNPKEKYFLDYCRLEKDGFSRIYNICDNKILPSERNSRLQAELCKIIEDYFQMNQSAGEDDYGNCGEIKVTDLSKNSVIGHVRIMMFGNPFKYYDDESFIPNDTANVAPGNFLRTDSVLIGENKEYGFYKNIFCYSENVPNDSCSRYNVYIRLGRGRRPTEKDITAIIQKVKMLVN